MVMMLSQPNRWAAWRYILLVLGVSASYVLYALFFDLPLLAGESESIVPLQTGFWAAIMTACLYGFGRWTAYASEVRIFRILADLPFPQGAAGINTIAAEWQAYCDRPRFRRAVRVTLIGGIITGIVFAVVTIGMTIDVPTMAQRLQFTGWYAVMLPPLFGYTGVHVYRNVLGNNFIMRRAVALTDIDLLRPERQLPFARLALRNGLVWILALTVVISLTLGDQVSTLGMMPLIGAAIFLAALSFLGPMQLIHKRLSDAKNAELERIAPMVREARLAAEGEGEAAAHAAMRLSGLLQWRQAVAASKEWPTDTGTLVRLFLYLAIPLGGWVASALVESVIESML